MIGIIKRTSTFLGKEILHNLYEAIVQPHLEYGNVIWSPYLKKQSLSQSQLKAYREEP